MNKFFRKHMKKLLAVFMALLLIVWLGGSALTNMMNSSLGGRVVGTTAHGEITAQDEIAAQNVTNMLQSIGLPWQQPFPGTSESLSVVDWILLTREAQRWGIDVREVECREFLNNALGITEDDIYRFASRRDIKVERIYSAVAEYLAVSEVTSLAVSSASRSEAVVRKAARDQLEKVRINLVALRASALADPDQTFSEAELQAHFETYRDKERAGGLNFGYVQPPQVKVQSIKIDVGAIADAIVIRERTLESKAREYWRENRETGEFRRPADEIEVETADQSDESSDDDDGTSDADEASSPFYETFDEARDIAVAAIRREYADAKAEAIVNWLVGALSEPWDNAETGDDGYKKGPADVVDESFFASVLERLPEQWSPFSDALSIGTTGYFKSSGAFQAAPELARAQFTRTTRGGARRFQQAAFRVQGIEPMPSDPEAPTFDYLAIGQTYPVPLKSSGGDRFVFRVVSAKPSGPAETLDVVRNEVIEDLRMLRGYERAKALANSLANSVTDAGLKTAYDADQELRNALGEVEGYFSPAPFARSAGSMGPFSQPGPSYVAGLGIVQQDTRDQCFALADSDKNPKVEVLEMENNGSVAVIEWVETLPLREDEYDAQRDRILAQLNRGLVSKVAVEWLEPQRIRDRNEFAFAQ